MRQLILTLGLTALLGPMALAQAQGSFNAMAVAKQAIELGQETQSGTTSETGLWVLAVGTMPLEGRTEKDARTLAGVEARKALASFISSSIAASTEYASQETDDSSSTAFATWARSDVNELLKGVQIVLTEARNGEMVAVAVLTERSIDASKTLAAAMANERPGTVQASGEGATAEEAIQAACRSALEQVCGSSMVASEATADGNLRSRAFTDVQGVVSAYRILSQEDVGGRYRVVIVAEVDKDALQESYGAQMKAIGDPIFWIVSSDDDAREQISDFLMGKGLKTSLKQGTSDYKVELLPKYRPMKHPGTGKSGTQLQLTVICYDKAGVKLFTLQNEPRKANAFVGDPDRQKQLCMEKAVKQISKPLHERLQRAINDLTNNGRTVRIVVRRVMTQEQCAFVESLVAQINDMPGASSATCSLNESVQVGTIRFTLKGNPEDFLGLLRERVPDLPPALSVSTNKIVFEL